jgi:tetratricopeptide (TPR) repeat protein
MSSQPSLAAAILGNPIGEYRPRWIGLSLAMILLACFGIWTIWIGVQQPFNLITLLFGAALAIGCFSLGFLLILRDAKRRLQVFELGLIDQRLTGHEVFRWDEIGQIRSELFSGYGMGRINLRRRDGKKLMLAGAPHLSRFQSLSLGSIQRLSLLDLLAIIEQASYPHRLATLERQYDAGQPVVFDKFKISSSGIHAKGTVLPWSQIDDIDTDAEANMMLVKRAGQQRPWKTFSLVNQPDGDVLPELISRSQGSDLSAFQGGTSQQMTKALNTRRWRRRLIQWVLIPLTVIGINLGIAQARYLLGPGVHMDRGQASFNNHNYAAALAEFDAALAKAPNNSDILTWRGQTYRELERFDAALADYDTVLKTSPDDRFVLVLRGRVYYRQGDYQRALDQYNAVVEQQPSYYYVYCNRGFTYKKMGLKAQAIADFTICGNLSKSWRERAAQEILALRNDVSQP